MKKWALITGASRGLGEVLSKRFWNEGWSLILLARNTASLEVVRNGLSKASDQDCEIFSCDLSKPPQVDAVISKITASFASVDVLINNAAIHGPIGPILSTPLAGWRDVMQVNFFTPVAFCQAFGLSMQTSNKGGVIINLAGGGATSSRPNFGAYASAKTALVRFSEILAQELSSDGVRVNCISPGAMQTELLKDVINAGDSLSGAKEYASASKVFLNGGASMEAVSDLALFLSGKSSANISGKLISSVWDDWSNWPNHERELSSSDIYTLRRIVARDRGFNWGDK